MNGESATLADYECIKNLQAENNDYAYQMDLTPAIPPATPPGNCEPDWDFYEIY